MSITEWLEEATPRQSTCGVCFDGRLVSRYESAKDRLRQMAGGMLGDTGRLSLQAEVAQLEDEIRDKTRTFVFESIGWGPWRDLVSKHPPEPDQAELFQRFVGLAFLPRREIEVHLPTFVPAAMAATCVEPGMTVAEAEAILGKASKLPGGVIDRLWAAVAAANLGGNADPFANGIIVSDEAKASERKSQLPSL